MTAAQNPNPLDPFRDLMGIDLPPERLRENLEAFRPILAEIQKLRALDLSAVHPTVVFRTLDPETGETPL
jgi:hypothetical protein